MMLPTGMQHIHPAHLQHFSPMGVGMGMGMGFGMNMLDLNGGPRGCSMIPLSPMQGAHFPSPSMSGASSFQGMAGGSLPVIGHPSQEFPMSLAGGHLAPVSGQPPINSATGMNTLKMGVHVESPNVNSKNLTKNTNLQKMHTAEARISSNQQSSQLQATNDEFDQSALMQKNDQGADVGATADDKSTRKKRHTTW